MENQVSPNPRPQSDEIDLGQLLQMIKDGFNRLFKGFLKIFVYLKKSSIKLGILLIVGIAIGYGLNKISNKILKTEVIVKPNLESKNYLYDVIDEIQANIASKDTLFFKSIGLQMDQLKNLRLSIEPVTENSKEANMDEDIKYLELLEKFDSDDLINDVVRTEILDKSSLNHRITFFHKDPVKGREVAEKLMEYINSNAYYAELVKINRENAQERISQNTNLIKQIDELITKYSDKIAQNDTSLEGKIVLDNEEKLDITGLFNLKNGLIRDNERKKVEIQNQKEAIRIINFGRTQQVRKSLLGKEIVLIPLILLGLFFLIEFVRYLNSKAKEMQLQ